MNRHIILAISCALFLSAACNDIQQTDLRPGEIAFSVPGETKGVIEGSNLYDAAEGTWRNILVTAYLKPASGQLFSERPYFTAETFSRSGEQRWTHDPAIYWPVGGVLDMIALSSTEPLLEPDVIWTTGNTAAGVRVAVDRHHTQDDIMYGALFEAGSSTTTTTLPMQHSQALIEVSCRRISGVNARLDSVILSSVFLEGDLEIMNNVGAPTIDWNFRRFRAYDVLVDDPEGIYGNNISTSARTVRMLIPEQQKTSITVIYTVGTSRRVHKETLAHENWLAGKKYHYELNFSPVASSAAAPMGQTIRTKGGDAPVMLTETVLPM